MAWPTSRPRVAGRCGLAAVAVAVGVCTADAKAAAHFWLSTSGGASAGPANASLALTEGDSATLFVWARPEAGKRLRNVSLNLVSDPAGVDFDDSGFTVFNTIGAAASRFGFVKDSSTWPALTSEFSQLEVEAGNPDELFDLQGFSIGADPGVLGIGPACLPGDPNCVIAGDGEPAWLFASIALQAVEAGTVRVWLQVGDSGLNQSAFAAGDYNQDGVVGVTDHGVWVSQFGSFGPAAADGNLDGVVDAADYTVWRDGLGGVGAIEPAAAAGVRFGVDALGGVEPLYNAATDRSYTLVGDDPDAVITIAAAASTAAAPLPSPEPSAATIAVFIAAPLLANHRRRG